jgi:divalent metal cation (Fe/Co/Zn/Cd) transporter
MTDWLKSVAYGTVVTLPAERRVALHHRALWLEYFTVGWNVVEAVVAIGAGVIAGSVALIGFGADSAIEVISALGLLWRLRKAGPDAAVSEESAAEKRALFVVAITFFLLAIYITQEAVTSLIGREEPLTSPVGIILAALSLVVMTGLAAVKQRVGKEMGSRALVADSKETWVCSYLSLSLLLGTGAYAIFGWWWADPIGALAMLPVILWQGWETLSEAREPNDHHD